MDSKGTHKGPRGSLAATARSGRRQRPIRPRSARSSSTADRSAWIWAATFAVGVTATVIAIVAAVALPETTAEDPWRPVLQEVLKTAYQFLAVGTLGGLAKLLIDRRRSAASERSELQSRQRDYIGLLVRASHDVDVARMTILANRSVKAWTDSINGAVVGSWAKLRDLAHELKNWEDAGTPVFPEELHLGDGIEEMTYYLWSLIDEHARNKQELGEVQRAAENANMSSDRSALLDEVWVGLKLLPRLSDLLSDGVEYGDFRGNYLAVLRGMRKSL